MSRASTSAHHVASRSASGRRRVGEADLRQLEAPVAVLAPDGLVQEAGHLAEVVVGHRAVHRGDRRRRARQDPAVGRAEVRGVGQAPLGVGGDRGRARAEHEPRRVPELVREVARVLDLRRPEPLVVARASCRGRPRTAARRRRARRSCPADRRCCPSSSTSSGRTGRGSGPTGRRCGRAAHRSGARPSIIIRATQKNRMS